MKIEDLKNISNQIFKHLTKISYDDSITFKGFRIDMMVNIQKFLSPDSIEKYEKNKRILNETNVQESLKTSQIDEYLKRLINDLINLISKMEYSTKEFEINKIEIMMALSNFLNPKKYDQNITVLKNAENQERQKQKLLTIPTR